MCIRDRNKDGKLSGDEIPERMRGNMASIDTNDDKEIDRAELEKMAQSFGGRGQGRPGGGGSGRGGEGGRPGGFGGGGGGRSGGGERPKRPALEGDGDGDN